MKLVLNKAPGISASFSVDPVMDERSWVRWGYRNSEASGVILGTCPELPKDSVYWLPANNIQSTEGLVGPRKGIRHPKEMCSSNFLILLTSIYMTYNSRDSIQGLIYVGQVFYD